MITLVEALGRIKNESVLAKLFGCFTIFANVVFVTLELIRVLAILGWAFELLACIVIYKINNNVKGELVSLYIPLARMGMTAKMRSFDVHMLTSL